MKDQKNPQDYYKALKFLYEKTKDKYDFVNSKEFSKQFNVKVTTLPILSENNLLLKNDKTMPYQYKWNTIPPNAKMVEKLLDKISTRHRKYNKSPKMKKTKKAGKVQLRTISSYLDALIILHSKYQEYGYIHWMNFCKENKLAKLFPVGVQELNIVEKKGRQIKWVHNGVPNWDLSKKLAEKCLELNKIRSAKKRESITNPIAEDKVKTYKTSTISIFWGLITIKREL